MSEVSSSTRETLLPRPPSKAPEDSNGEVCRAPPFVGGDGRRPGVRFGYSRSARLIVSVPASSDVSARSGDGSIDLEGVTGHLQLTSGDGSIRALHVNGELDVHTGDGSVTVSGKLAAVRARSGD